MNRTPSTPSPPGSESSGSKPNNAAQLDLGAKYQKLASEYAKVHLESRQARNIVIISSFYVS